MARIIRRVGSAGVIRRTVARARPRRLQLFVVGLGKTGTTSMAATFGAYRSGHEVDATRMKRLAGQARTGDLDPARTKRELRRRDLRYRLEVDSAQFLTPFVTQLAALHPRARFVVLIRDCFSWMNSLLEHWARVTQRVPEGRADTLEASGIYELPDVVRSWFTVEGQLREGRATAGLAASLLRTWGTTYPRLLAEVPEGRTLVIRTDDIDTSALQLAEFCAVDPATLRPGLHWNVGPSRQGVLGAVPQALVLREAERWCTPLMERYWGPEWRDLVARIPAGTGTSAG